ncbi:MAG: non-canonical purine NTP pyrophosphatase [Thermoleophilia bacterium]
MTTSAGDDTQGLRVVLATRNPGKAREFGRLLGPGFRVEPLPDDVEMPEETGVTFAENARLKAVGAYRALEGGAAVLADDSGIEVPALGGAPGVRSARFAGADAGDRRNVALLLERLAPYPDRTARFVCALVLALPGGTDTPELVETEGVLQGAVAETPLGSGGFGYDPVFRPDGWVLTLGEASGDEKDAVSHRARAVRSLLETLSRRGVVVAGSDEASTGEGGDRGG